MPSTTTLYLARQLLGKRDLTVITNSIQIVSELGGKRDLRSSQQEECPGIAPFLAWVLWLLESCGNTILIGLLCPARLFLGKKGSWTQNDLEVELKRLAIANARESVALVDSSKFQQPALLQIGPVEIISKLVTDRMDSKCSRN